MLNPFTSIADYVTNLGEPGWYLIGGMVCLILCFIFVWFLILPNMHVKEGARSSGYGRGISGKGGGSGSSSTMSDSQATKLISGILLTVLFAGISMFSFVKSFEAKFSIEDTPLDKIL